MTGAAAWAAAALGYSFRDERLLALALTHRSAAGLHNERLEFLGDAILGLVMADALYAAHPGADEGALSRLRARLVRRETLEELARALDLGPHLTLGSGELRSGGHRRGSILANSLEAVFGAVYLDAGFEAASDVIRRLLSGHFAELDLDEDLRDPKTRLQELLQANGLPLPDYEVEQVAGSPHDQTFSVRCRLTGDREFRGEGASRRAAEQQAAERALAELANGL